MLCKQCGIEIKEGWKICPCCGYPIPKETEDTKPEGREYKLKGMRRTGRFSFQEIVTDIKVEGEAIHVITQGVKKSESQFSKKEVQSVDLPLLLIWKASDILRLAVFGMLAFVTYGLSIFAVLFSIKIMVSRHVRIKLYSGQTIKIPVCQKADASEFLKELPYPLSEIEKNNAEKMDGKKWARREWITSMALLAVAAGTIALGLTLKSESTQNPGNREIADKGEKQGDGELIQEDKNIPKDAELDVSFEQVEPGPNESAETKIDDIGMYLTNDSGALPIKVGNVYQKSDYIGFTTVGFDMENVSGVDVKEATFGVTAWDSNLLPLELTAMYYYDSTYFYRCQGSNIAAGQTSQGSLAFEQKDFKYIQILLLEYSDFDGNIWTNPAISYYEENFAGKKFDENTMTAFVFGTDNTDEVDGIMDSQEDTVSYTGDFVTDVANGVLYGKNGIIVDVNGNAILDYIDYFVTEEGYISNGDWVEEGYGIDSTGKIITFQP